MLKIDGNNIYLTRGDSAAIALEIKNGETDYDFSSDTVKFAVKKNVQDQNKVIEKTFDENGQIVLTPEDTKTLNFGQYWYDVQLEHDNDGTVEVATVIVPSVFEIGAEVN